jgi:SAM-dependent methyltransferase
MRRANPNISKIIRRNLLKPAWLYFMRSKPKPLSDQYGFDRGKPLDRYYIEKFLSENVVSVRGRCLELLNDDYSKKYGGNFITSQHVLDIDPKNKNATIIGDIRNLYPIPNGSFDCIILTQVLQFIDNLEAAIFECDRILDQHGTLLATLPAISRIDCTSGIEGDYWRFTIASARFLFAKAFPGSKIDIFSYGNVRAGIYFYAGLAVEDISERVLDIDDPNFPLIVGVRVRK